MEELDGLINGALVDPMMKQSVLSSFPHYGHSGIVKAARELYKQIEGSNADDVSSSGFLSYLLGAGCECEGYAVRVVGHSLGGAIAAMIGIRLHGQFPDLHVYSYGPLPCVDSIVAGACSSFITCIVHDSEFSSYLSINSILRLRAAALTTMAQGTTVDTAMIYKMAQLFICLSKQQKRQVVKPIPDAPVIEVAPQSHTNDATVTETNTHVIDTGEYSFLEDESHVKENGNESMIDDSVDDYGYPFVIGESPVEDPVSQFMHAVPSIERRSAGDLPEVFLPGLVIHLIRQQRGIKLPLWKGSRAQEKEPPYRAILADR